MRTLCRLSRRIKRMVKRSAKRILSYILVGSIICIMLSTCLLAEDLTLSENAFPIEGNDFFMWYLVSISGHNATELDYYTYRKNDSNSFSMPLSNTNYVWIYPFTNIVDSSGKQLELERDYTYQLTFQFQNGNMPGWGTMDNFSPRILRSADAPLSESVLLTDYVSDGSYTCTVTELGSFMEAKIVFHMSEFIHDGKYIAPYMYFTGGSQCYIRFLSCIGYADPDYSAWEMLVNGQLQDIYAQLQANGVQNHDDLMDIKNELGDNGEGDDYNTNVEDAVGNLSNQESDINSSLQGHMFQLGNTNILVDENVFNRLDNYFNNLNTAEGYDTNVGILMNRTFDVFVDYLGIVMLISLTLGTAVSFLTHKEVWRR